MTVAGANVIGIVTDSANTTRTNFNGVTDNSGIFTYTWNVLDELNVDRSKVFVILSKSDNTHSERIDEIAIALRISNPIVISSKTGYGIHKLKTMIAIYLIKISIDIPK